MTLQILDKNIFTENFATTNGGFFLLNFLFLIGVMLLFYGKIIINGENKFISNYVENGNGGFI